MTKTDPVYGDGPKSNDPRLGIINRFKGRVLKILQSTLTRKELNEQRDIYDEQISIKAQARSLQKSHFPRNK